MNMRRWIFVILLITLVTLSGCDKSEKLKTDDSSDPIENPKEISEFSILIGDEKVSLMDWDDKVDLEEIFGKPIEEKIEKLGPGSDTFEGSFIKEVKFSGIEFEMFSPKENGKSFFVLSMEVTDSKFETKRGIKVGDGLEKLNEMYPEIQPVLDGREDSNNRGYKIEEGAYNYLTFEVKDGIIINIKIYHEFA